MSNFGKRNLDSECKIEGCGRGCWKDVCTPCARKIRTGRLPEQFGVRKNPPCSVKGCTAPRNTSKSGYCRGHYTKSLEGVDPIKKRDKMPHGSQTNCKREECAKPARSRGLCWNHYSQAKYVPVEKVPCKTEGCEVNTRTSGRDYCKRHGDQMDKYGFSWTGKRPADKYRAWVEKQLEPCLVPRCNRKGKHRTPSLCTTHYSDRINKSCDLDTYLALKSIDKCQSCGSEENLVVDHDHSHHPESERKMCPECIRGVLCASCNSALGFLKEDIRILNSLAKYITRFENRPRGI